MVLQRIDSKFNESGLANSGTFLPISDKQHLPAKKTALRDLQNDNRIVVPKSSGNSPLLKKRGPITDTINLSGSKRPTPECLPSPARRQSPSSSISNGHLVFVRRKSDCERGKNSTSDCTDDNVNSPQPRQLSHVEQETPRQQTKIHEPKLSCFSAFAPIPMGSLMTFSSGEPSVPLSPGKPGNGLSPAEHNYRTFASALPIPVHVQGTSDQQWKERFLILQTVLKSCDDSRREEYIQMLRSLSSVAQSMHAVELEKRAIHLLLEEGKEIYRMKALNVLGKSAPKNDVSPLTQQDQLDK